MPNLGDELHHFGWNACSSCHGDEHKARRFLIVPGFRSSRIHILDTEDQRAPRLHKVIEPDEVKAKTNLTAPHTVHCLADGHVMISMLGDAEGNAPGGFLLLDDDFNIAGRWEAGADGMPFNYDFWYQPRHNVMVSSELGAPKTYRARASALTTSTPGSTGAASTSGIGKTRRIAQTVDLGEEGLIPLGSPLSSRSGQHARLSSARRSAAPCGTGTSRTASGRSRSRLASRPSKSRAGPSPCPR